MKIYTQTGDQGETGIIGGRVSKDDLRIEAYGTLDECNSMVGLVLATLSERILPEGKNESLMDDLKADLLRIQHELFDCGSDLAYAQPAERGYKVQDEMVIWLEQSIDRYDAETPDITKFILPGGTVIAAQLHLCRTMIRRAERRTVTLAASHPVNGQVIRYLNRLSDWFFTVARVANYREGVSDIEYVRSADVFRKTK